MDFREWVDINENTKLSELVESASANRYSVEVNYRSKAEEVLREYSKIVLGFVSAALKQNGFHVKHVFDENPVRILVSSRHWDDGEWIGVAHFYPKDRCFVISKGFYNKDRKTVSIQSTQKCAGDSAAEVTQELRNLMHHLKGKPDRHQEKLKGVPMKRGPKR